MPKRGRRRSRAEITPGAIEYFRQQGARGGAIGGKKRFAPLTPEQRSAIGRAAALARWSKAKVKKK